MRDDMNYINPPVYDFIVSFDFDGTLFEEEWPLVGKSINDIHDVLRYCYDKGYIIQLNTLREDGKLDDALCAMHHCKLPVHLINCNAPQRVIRYYNSRKLGYDILIDDRNAGGLLPKDQYLYYIDKAFSRSKYGSLLSDTEKDAIMNTIYNDCYLDEHFGWEDEYDKLIKEKYERSTKD